MISIKIARPSWVAVVRGQPPAPAGRHRQQQRSGYGELPQAARDRARGALHYFQRAHASAPPAAT